MNDQTHGSWGCLETLEERIAPATFVVSSVGDDGGGTTLREAIESANARPGKDKIIFDKSVFSEAQTIALTLGNFRSRTA